MEGNIEKSRIFYEPASSNYGTRTHPEGSQKYHGYITNQGVAFNHEPSLNTTSTEVILHPVARTHASSTSTENFCLKPTFNASIKKRFSKNNIFSKNDAWKAPKGKSRTSVQSNEVRTSITSRIEAPAGMAGHTKSTRTTPNNKDLSALLKCSSQSIESFKEDCHRIEIAFLNCSRIDQVSRTTNLNILAKLYQLVCCGGGMEWKPRAERVVRFITHYLCENLHLLSQLVYIITDSEDLQTCLYAIKILYLLLVKGDRFDEGDRSAMITALSCPIILETLIESMYFIDIRFLGDAKYKQELQKLHSHILQMIVTICKTNPCREQLVDASEGTVRFIGKLTSTCYKNRDLANSLLEALKIISVTRRNCKHLTSKRFFDGLCMCCNLTNKLFTTTKILKAMSRNESTLDCMSENDKVINLILTLIYYNGKKSINKRSLFTTLYRIINTENDSEVFPKNKIFDKLYHYFLKNEKHNHRLEAIKAYTILNRLSGLRILPNMKLNMGLCLPENVKKFMEKEPLLEGSDSENDDSEEDSQHDDDSEEDSQDDNESDEFDADDKEWSSEHIKEEPLADMCDFYVEHLLNAGENDYSTIYDFDMYEGILNLSNGKVIENRVHRGVNMDKLAYPDALMLDPEFDDHTFNSSVNNFSIKKLAHKLRRLKLDDNLYTPRVVYDLDQLQENSRQSMAIPHPSTYSYNAKKMDELPQTSPSSFKSLKFESRFECGNLRRATQIEKFEYELQLSPDTNTSKGLQWFYFQVTNMTPRVFYTFNITNCLNFSSQYNHGMQPLMFSVIDHALNKTGWKRVGREIIYYGNNCTNETGSKQYKSLSFSVSFQYSNDFVYFSYHYPYTYTRLMIKLFPLIKHKTNQVYARIDRLCKTVNNKNEIALLTITGAWNRIGSLRIPLSRRPIIFITARINPGETNSSWIMEGIIKFLLHETDQNAITAREHFIFKIIPMLNPEGVIYGNQTCGLTGANLNRCWIRPNKATCPEIYHAKRLVACAKKVLRFPVAACIDIHGHSQKKFFFFYGCNPKMSWNEEDRVSGDFSEILKLLPEMVQSTNPNISLAQCKYKISRNRESTGRVVMWREFGIKHSFTLECSYSFANEIQSINTKILTNIGASVVASLGKIADKMYTFKEAESSLSLDYRCINNVPTIISEPPKNKEVDSAMITSFFNKFNCEETVSGSESCPS